jgi:hypothetical protein
MSCLARRLVLAGLMLSLAACSDEAPKRLSDSLAQVGIKDVVVDEQKIGATCSQGDKVEVPTAELERNFLGMSSPKKVVLVAKNIAKDCEDKDTTKKREAAQKARLGDVLKELGIDATGLDDAATKKAICAKLTAGLPRKEPERMQGGAKNTREWGCEPPAAPEALPTGLWETVVGKAECKKPAVSYARLKNEDGGRLTLRCTGTGKAAKAEIYVGFAEKTKFKKGTKAVMVSLDGKKPAKWKANVAKDLSALFFDPKAALEPLGGANKMSVELPTAKKSQKVAFDVKGFAEATKALPAPCK